VSPREIAADELDQVVVAMAAPERWAVAVFFQGELLCVCNGTYPDESKARAVAAEKRRMFTQHEVRVYKSETFWTEAA
jgi:hypothetical protein